MIIEVIKSLTLALKKKFPMYYKSLDITEGFERPCMTLEVDEVESGVIGEDLITVDLPITVYFFSEELEKGYYELLKVQEQLRMFFSKPFYVTDTFVVFSPEVEFSINMSDKSLTARVFYNIICRRNEYIDETGNVVGEKNDSEEYSNDEMMEELKIKEDC